jgi:hypothetical protein
LHFNSVLRPSASSTMRRKSMNELLTSLSASASLVFYHQHKHTNGEIWVTKFLLHKLFKACAASLRLRMLLPFVGVVVISRLCASDLFVFAALFIRLRGSGGKFKNDLRIKPRIHHHRIITSEDVGETNENIPTRNAASPSSPSAFALRALLISS